MCESPVLASSQLLQMIVLLQVPHSPGLERLGCSSHFCGNTLPCAFALSLLFKFHVVLVFQIPHTFCFTYKFPFFLARMDVCVQICVSVKKKKVSFLGCLAILKASPVTVGSHAFSVGENLAFQPTSFPFLPLFLNPLKKKSI